MLNKVNTTVSSRKKCTPIALLKKIMKSQTSHHWLPFTSGDAVYDLVHLHPQQRCFTVQPKTGASIELKVNISFSFHCFTSSEVDAVSGSLIFPDPDKREVRYFDLQRYQLSQELLLKMIGTIEKRPLWRTDSEEFFSVEINHQGRKIDYTVFFEVGRAKKNLNHDLWLYVRSAYPKEQSPAKQDRVIRFETILLKSYFASRK